MLTFCMLGNWHTFLLSAEIFKIFFYKYSFMNTIRESNGLDPYWKNLLYD